MRPLFASATVQLWRGVGCFSISVLMDWLFQRIHKSRAEEQTPAIRGSSNLHRCAPFTASVILAVVHSTIANGAGATMRPQPKPTTAAERQLFDECKRIMKENGPESTKFALRCNAIKSWVIYAPPEIFNFLPRH